jgi:hypothetical protein
VLGGAKEDLALLARYENPTNPYYSYNPDDNPSNPNNNPSDPDDNPNIGMMMF